jgi:hypothetical protein
MMVASRRACVGIHTTDESATSRTQEAREQGFIRYAKLLGLGTRLAGQGLMVEVRLR